MDWSLLSCGRNGHISYAPDEPELRAQLSAGLSDGEAWQCLRCGAFVPGAPSGHGPAAQAPMVARGKEIRSRLILRVFAVERVIRALLFGAASYLLWHYRHSRAALDRAFDRELPVLRGLFRQLGYNIDKSKLVGLLRHALTLSSHTITLLAMGLALYAAIEIIEAVGLWTARRWGEYFAMVATSLGLPLEIYDLTRKVTATALLLLLINLALVLYLAVTKRLFGIRGGKAAYDARLREESVFEAAIEAAERHGAATGGPASVVVARSAKPARAATDDADQAPGMATGTAAGATAVPDAGETAAAGAANDADPRAADRR